jgi:gamma-glutamyl:cysteine ligase YbdK (ATP-grasp superfamily)
MHSELIDFAQDRRVPAAEQLDGLLEQSRPFAESLGCAEELEGIEAVAVQTGADKQLARSRSLGSLPRLVATLADDFLAGT